MTNLTTPRFTPGPWRVHDSQVESMAVPPDEYGNQSLGINLYGAMGGEDTKADAYLIAAAPTLFSLLTQAADKLSDYCSEINGDMNDPLATKIYSVLKQITLTESY